MHRQLTQTLVMATMLVPVIAFAAVYRMVGQVVRETR
jgi:hypothetical protein